MDPNENHVNENQIKSKYSAAEISVLVSLIVFLMTAILLIQLNYSMDSIISTSLGTAGFFLAIFFTILPENTNIIDYIDTKIRKHTISIIFILLVIVIILFFIIFFIVDSYMLSGAEEGKINCIFPDGQRRSIALGEIHNEELISVFPQLENIPFVTIQTYASNGNSTSKFHEDELRSNYYEINFKNFDATLDCNTGWMIGPLMGFDAQKYSHLSFEVKGERGGEKFGVKLKDRNGIESKINVTGLDFEVTRNWQEVKIKLGEFDRLPHPNRSDLNVITIFSDGSMYSETADPETIYVRGFKFE